MNHFLQSVNMHDIRWWGAMFFGFWLLLAVVPGLPLVLFLEKGSTLNRAGWGLQKFLSVDLVFAGTILATVGLFRDGHPTTWSEIWAVFLDGTILTLGLSFWAAGLVLGIVIKRLAPPEDKTAKGWRKVMQ